MYAKVETNNSILPTCVLSFLSLLVLKKKKRTFLILPSGSLDGGGPCFGSWAQISGLCRFESSSSSTVKARTSINKKFFPVFCWKKKRILIQKNYSEE